MALTAFAEQKGAVGQSQRGDRIAFRALFDATPSSLEVGPECDRDHSRRSGTQINYVYKDTEKVQRTKLCATDDWSATRGDVSIIREDFHA